MGRLDVQVMRHMGKDDFRVLTAVEMGMRNHHAVPVPLVVSIAGLRRGGAAKFLATLLRFKLVYHDNTKYDGYRLTWFGYDVLALRVFLKRGSVDSVGRKIGEGKESDVYEGTRSSDGRRVVIKLHRLGKTSFKAVKAKRDYLDGRATAGNWLNMSRLAARREWDFLSCLRADGCVRVPEPLDQNRHAVVMGLADGLPLYQLGAPGCLADPEAVLDDCVHMARALAQRGLVHCDLNEFNLIVEAATSQVTLIDFPQMISTAHPNAQAYFERDVRGLIKFFTMKLKYDIAPDDVRDILSLENAVAHAPPDAVRLDVATKASGYDGTQPDKREGRGKFRRDDDDDDALSDADAADEAAAAASDAEEEASDAEEEGVADAADGDCADDDDAGDDAGDDGADDADSDDADGLETVDAAALRAKFLAQARLDAPPAPEPAPRTSFFDEAAEPAALNEVCARKLRRERAKGTERRAAHNGAGKSRNFAKVRTGHGKIRHKERLDGY